ncbi:MAG: DUF4291 domain-containing protein [Bacteroidota bacterium]
MNFTHIPLSTYLAQIPPCGQHILAQQKEDQILVYQAFSPHIADYALAHQHFGGPAYSYNRMSWIKPNFLWMMYRCGWAAKENQKRVLGIWIDKQDFESILREATYSSYQSDIYESREAWKASLAKTEVRLQWDPDHDIYGNKEIRRAIQLGLKGDMLKKFGKEMIRAIIDLTEFSQSQKLKIDQKNTEEVQIPLEEIYLSNDPSLNKKLGIGTKT